MDPTHQTGSKVERLGYPTGTKLLILHADDLGLAHSVNAAAIAAFEMGAISSASIIVPAPWTPEIVGWVKDHSEADVGVHFALTSEWPPLRWRGIVAPAEAPTLYDAEGFLPRTTLEVQRKRLPPRRKPSCAHSSREHRTWDCGLHTSIGTCSPS